MSQLKITLSIFIGVLLFSMNVSGQDWEKMNKKELRAAIDQFQFNIDSLQKQIVVLDENKENLRQQLETLKSSAELNNQKLSETKNQLTATEKKIEALRVRIEQQQQQISKLEEEKRIVTDSIANLNQTVTNLTKLNTILSSSKNNNENNFGSTSNTNSGTIINKSNPNDFLNKYFFELSPLMNNRFSFSLSKIIIGDVNYKKRNNNYYDNDEERGAELLLPEILNAEDFSFWTSKVGEYIETDNSRDGLKASSVLEVRERDFLNKRMPTFEILKNKLFTMQFKNKGTEESFLFNINKSGTNNLRSKVAIKLANEDVKADGENSKARDIIWEIINIGEESYIALTEEQINRLNVALSDWGEYNSNDQTRSYERKSKYVNNRYITYYEINTEKVYLSRNKDKFMDGGYFINPNTCIFLFKINPL
jgi:predicted  nucleic acid-binding Zn-ribbon protein